MIYNFKARTGTDLDGYYKKHRDAYNKSALDFLKDTKTLLSIDYLYKGLHFADDKQVRDIYSITLTNDKHSYRFNFGDSIANTEKDGKRNGLTPYDVLACLQEDHSEDLKDFCDNYGYDHLDEENYSGNYVNAKAQTTYHAVKLETDNLRELFTDEELEKLSEIN
jgi:hypothetical protein